MTHTETRKSRDVLSDDYEEKIPCKQTIRWWYLVTFMKQKEIEQHLYNKEAIEQKKRVALLSQLKEQEVDVENNEKLREE